MKTTFTLLAACAAFATGAIAAPAVISADSAEIVAADSKTVTRWASKSYAYFCDSDGCLQRLSMSEKADSSSYFKVILNDCYAHTQNTVIYC